MSFFNLSRGPRTLLAGMVLGVIYYAFVSLTAPWLDVEQVRPVLPSAASGNTKTAEFGKRSDDWFPEDHWVSNAGKKFRDGRRYLFFQTFSLFNENRSMRVEPVAMAWESEDEAESPVTISAASAQLDRSSAFNIAEQEFGRITAAHLAGDVYIRGPNGLRIVGRNFYVSEQSMMVWSSQPVDFAWENHTGRAEGGIEIQLLSSGSTEGGLMTVSDIHSLRLMGRVTCNLVLRDKDPGKEVNRIRINAARSFEYSVATRMAVFSGYEDREAIPENQILVERPNDSGTVDKLLCTQLTLHMRPRVNADPQKEQAAHRVELHSILAEGSRVVVWLEEHKVQATMTSLRYTIDENLLEMWHNKIDEAGRPYPVEIRQDGSEIFVPRILVLHGQQNQIHSMECLGPGIIRHKAKTNPDAVEATWSKSLVYRQSPEQRIVMEGNAQVARPSQQFRMAGGRIEMQLDSANEMELKTGSSMEQVSAASGAPESVGSLNFARLKPRRLIATDSVKLTAPQISGLARNELNVVFSDQNNGPTSSDSSASDSQNERTKGITPGSSGSGFTNFVADTMEATLQLMTRNDRTTADFSDVWLKGTVEVDYTAADPEQSFNATGNVLFARGGIDAGRDISLFGDPAAVVSTTRRIEGQRIELSELAKEFRIEGSGRIRFVVDALFGQPLVKPSPLDIYWTDKMHFSGRTASFVGNIRAVMKDPKSHDIQMKCAVMKVHLMNDVDLRQKSSDTRTNVRQASSRKPPETNRQAAEIEKIECQGLVTFHAHQMIDGIPEARRNCKFTDLTVNLQTGDFHAIGPGRIESTQPDRGNALKVSPGVTVRSNTAVRASETPFVFVSADFIGTVSGNINQQVVRLNHHVVGVFGPVRRLGETIDVNGVNTAELPPQAGILRCEQLTVSAIPGAHEGERSFSLLAETKARMELKEFSGEADRITYDHSKEQYILRSEQDRMSAVSHRPGVGRDLQRFVGQKFEYYPPPRNKLIVNQIIGLDGVFDPSSQ